MRGRVVTLKVEDALVEDMKRSAVQNQRTFSAEVRNAMMQYLKAADECAEGPSSDQEAVR